MQSTCNHWLVGLSVVLAMLVSLTALRLAARVASSERRGARIWLALGAAAMGVGIWSMHFVGMLAFSLPIPLAYEIPATLASLAVAMATSGFALWMTTMRPLSRTRLGGGAVVMGTGIAAMHYMGMAAIAIVPGISYDPLLVGLSILIAIVASFAALWLSVRLRDGNSSSQWLMRLAAAIVMGLAISGMHYTGMAAARFSPGSFCRGGVIIHNSWLAVAIGLFAVGLLLLTLITALYDAHFQSAARVHARRLEQANAQLSHQATHDALTGLPNRVLFRDRLEREIEHGKRDGRSFAVLVVDLDRFKIINDTLGHPIGDQLLSTIAQRLSSTVRAADTVARAGGDEFLVLVTGIRDPSDAATLANKINVKLDESVLVAEADVHTSASIGISVYPNDGIDSDSLMARADEAMYCAKQHGRNTFQFYTPGLNVFSRERLDLERDLRRALPMKQFEVHYQPKMDVASGRMNSVEALLRWRHPTRGMVGPMQFIPLAEETGLMLPIGEWVLFECCRQARQWQLDGQPFIRIAVNISPMHFRKTKFLEVVRAALAAHDLDPRYLEIELTETTVMDHAESSVGILEQLSRMGVIVSIDDFGTGYSSMSYLRRFPIDKLKIDRSFIADLTTSAEAAAIVKTIISLAHSLRIKVIAEGVETAEQLQQLRALGCDQYQGYYRSVALPPGELEKFIRAAAVANHLPQDTTSGETSSKLAVLRA